MLHPSGTQLLSLLVPPRVILNSSVFRKIPVVVVPRANAELNALAIYGY